MVDTTLCAEGLLEVEKLNITFKDLKVGKTSRHTGKFEKMSVCW